MVATLGPDAWPAPPLEVFAERIAQPRHLHSLLRDQRVIAGIGRSWVDEILWEVGLSPFKGAQDIDTAEVARLRMRLRGGARATSSSTTRRSSASSIPDKMPMPLRVHRREGEPCPRCGTTIEAVFFASTR